MKVPFLDLHAGYVELKSEIDEAIKQVLDSGWYLLGSELEAFEAEFAEYVGARYCVGVGSGLDALHLSLLAAGIGPGDKVIVPSNTFIATWLAVDYAGATPVPVEPDAGTYNLDPERLEDAVDANTRAIIPVHLYGQPADMEAIVAVAARHGLIVIADAAQAHGARYRQRPLGALGDASAWSFYPGKNLGCFGDGGALTTDDAILANRVRMLRNYGSEVKYVNQIKGFNSRLDEVQAAVLRVKLRHLDRWNERRKQVAARYLRELRDSELILPTVPDWADPVWHLFVVRSRERDVLRDRLKLLDVECGVHYPIPPHFQEAYSDLSYGPGSLPISETIHAEVLSLPIGPHLTEEQLDHVLSAIGQPVS